MYKFLTLITVVSVLIIVSPVYAETDCSATARGITTFECPTSPSQFVCGVAPNYRCPDSIGTLNPRNTYNCNSTTCEVVCDSGYADCNGVSGDGCEYPVPSGSCEGGSGTWTGSNCSRVCTPNPRPSVTLAPFSIQTDDQENPSIWIEKTGGGDMLNFQGRGGDVIINNAGQLLFWETVVDATENMIFGSITAGSVGNVLLFQKDLGEPMMDLLKLDNNGNLTVGNNLIITAGLRLPVLSSSTLSVTGSMYYDSDVNEIMVYNGTSWQSVGGGAYTAGEHIRIEGNIIHATTDEGCFGPIYQQKSSASGDGSAGGYSRANSACGDGLHVCTTTEILNSINCGNIYERDLSVGDDVWVSNGAAFLPTPANDCNGWTEGGSAWDGIMYRYTSLGGSFYSEDCNTSIPFACCS